MKRITVILLACLLIICGCTKTANKEGEELPTPIVFVDPEMPVWTQSPDNLHIDWPPISCWDYEDYENFRDTAVNLPINFVIYDDVAKWGDFDYFMVLSTETRQCTYYKYQFVDFTGDTFSLFVDHRKKEADTQTLDSNSINRNDMRMSKAQGIYAESGVYYLYNIEGKLISVKWQKDGISYCLNKIYGGCLGNYPANASSPISKMLNVDTALEFLGLSD